jgi:lysophospholipase L1-like esterase
VGRRAWLVVVSVLLGLPACSHTTTRTATRPIAYDAIGASETVGVGADHPDTEAWPTVFWKTISAARSSGSSYHNYGISGAKVSDALARELPRAQADHPTLVTVWLNVNDIIAQVPAAAYESQLRKLVHGLRESGRGGRAMVLVANTPPLDILPRVKPFAPLVDAVVKSYNDAIARVVSEEGAVLVDLYAAGQAAKAKGTAASLVGRDGFHPSTAGHAAVAAAFAAAYRHTR